MIKDHKDLLKVPELPEDVNIFISAVEKVNTLTGFFLVIFTLYSHFPKVRQFPHTNYASKNMPVHQLIAVSTRLAKFMVNCE